MFGFGGGYAMLSLIQHEVVDHYQWLTLQQFTDVVAISQMTPGPIGINSATYVGYSVTQSVWGAIAATIAVCLPSFILVLLISYFFVKCKDNKYIKAAMSGLLPMSVSLIAAAALLLMNKENFIDYRSSLIFYNPQIQISAESETKRSIFREKDKTKRSKKESAQHSKSRNKSFVMTSVSAL